MYGFRKLNIRLVFIPESIVSNFLFLFCNIFAVIRSDEIYLFIYFDIHYSTDLPQSTIFLTKKNQHVWW